MILVRTGSLTGSILFVQEFIARENIRRFEAQLAECTDADQRGVLSRLLEQARVDLAAAEARKGKKATG
jgi:hypothetical protein